MANELHTLNVNGTNYPLAPQKLYIYGNENDTNYPLVFSGAIGSSTAGNGTIQTIYTDTANSVYYNPKTNILTAPIFSGALNGNANTATYLYKTIALGSNSNTNTNKWIKFASIDISSGAWVQCTGHLFFYDSEGGGVFGILGMHLRSSSTIATTSCYLCWTSLSKIEYANSVAAVKTADGKFDLYWKSIDDYKSMHIEYLGAYSSRITFNKGSYTDSITPFAVSALKAYSSTAAEADKLTTARTLWGQSFDGTTDISGALSNVGHITSSANNSYDLGTASNQFRYLYAGWIGSGTNQPLEFGANSAYHIAIDTTGKVGIGTRNPSAKLDVAGDIRTTGNITLYAASGNSPKIKFYRGNTSDNLCDWTIQDIGGKLTFIEHNSGNDSTAIELCTNKITTTWGITSDSLATTNDVTVGKNLTVTGSSAFVGASTFTGKSTHNGGIDTETLTVNGESTFTGVTTHNGGITAASLAVTGASTFTGKTTHNGGITAASLAVTGASTFTGKTTHNGGIGTTSLTTSANATIGGTLAVTGASTFTGKTTHNGGIGTTSLTTSANATIGGTLNVTGASTFTGKTTHNGGIETTTLGATDAVTFTSTLDVTGASTFTGKTTHNSGIDLASAQNIFWKDRGAWGNNSATYPYSYGGLYWQGTSDNIKIFGREDSSDQLNLVFAFGDDTSHKIIFSDNGTESSYINSTGDWVAKNLTTTNNCEVQNNLTVTGTSAFTGKTTHNGGIGAASLDVSGTSTFTGKTTHNGGIGAASLTVTGTSTFTGKTTHNGGIGTTTLSASSNVSIGGTLAVTGTSAFTGKTTHNGGIEAASLAVSGTSTFTGKTTHNGGIGTTTLSASSNVSIGGTLAVTGTSTFTGHTTHNAGITVPASQKVIVGSSYMIYNSTTGCLEISC